MTAVRMVVLFGILLFLSCCAHGEDVQGFEGGTVLLNITSSREFDQPPWFDETKSLNLMIVESDGTAETILDWPTGFVVAMADVHSEQFKARMSLISYGLPGQHRGPSAVKITDLRPGDALTDGRYFQFRQPGDARGPPMELRVFAITVSASPNPAAIGQTVALTCSVEGGSPDRFIWTHEETGQTTSETRDPQGKSYTAEFTVKPDSEGSYICTVSGSIGQGRKSIDLHVGAAMITTATTSHTLASSVLVPTAEKFSTTKTSMHYWTLGTKPVQQSAKESDKVSTEAIIACVFGGLILMIIVAVVVVVALFLRRKRREREIEEGMCHILLFSSYNHLVCFIFAKPPLFLT
ncbi:uncharacterized protein [Branchiostoma lanceolatum]|uniref:uncharacterized protein isoform X2 n=1 Tax=Branchiostoma lanceolatum TaxID=7740 RepID=UPI00345500BE